MYKGASQRAQIRLDRGTAQDAIRSSGGPVPPKEELENLKAAIARLEAQIVASPPGSPIRKHLARQKGALSERSALLRRDLTGGRIPPRWDVVYAIYRELVIEEVGVKKDSQMLDAAKDLYCERVGVLRDQVSF